MNVVALINLIERRSVGVQPRSKLAIELVAAIPTEQNPALQEIASHPKRMNIAPVRI